MDSFDHCISPGETTDDTETYQSDQKPVSVKYNHYDEEGMPNEDASGINHNGLLSDTKPRGYDALSAELHTEMSKNIELHNKYIRAAAILRKIDQQNQDLLDVFLDIGQGRLKELPEPPTMVLTEEQKARYDLLH